MQTQDISRLVYHMRASQELLTHEEHRELETFDLARLLLIVEREVLLAAITLQDGELGVRVSLFLLLHVGLERVSSGLPIKRKHLGLVLIART